MSLDAHSMGQRLHLTLPLPPSVNEAYAEVIRYSKYGRWYTQRIATKVLVDYQKEARRTLQKLGVRKDSWTEVQAIGYEARVYVRTRSSDLDNRGKAWKDVVFPWLGVNDNRVEEAHEVRRLDAQNPRIVLEIYPVEQAQVGDL